MMLAQVQDVLGDTKQRAYYTSLQQKEYLHMIKVQPGNPLAYGRYCLTCMQFQQMPAAHAFLTKGLQVRECWPPGVRRS